MLGVATEKTLAGHEDYLADVLRLWDCYERSWVAGAPVILRFENRDVMAHEEAAHWSFAAASAIQDAPEGDEECFCWRPDREGSWPIGSLLCPEDLVGVLDQASARLSSTKLVK